MTKAILLDGKAIAEATIARVAAETRALLGRGVKPGLATVLVGSDPASQAYVASKGKAALACGFHSEQITLPSTTGEAELLALVARLNADPRSTAFSCSCRCRRGSTPRACSRRSIRRRTSTASTRSTSDGSRSARRIARSSPARRPARWSCSTGRAPRWDDAAGQEAVVIGRSNIVGKPMAQLLLPRHCTVTIAHSRTRDLPAVARRADILVAAVGKPEMVRGDWVKPGAIVIDVGINRISAQGLDAAGRRRPASSATWRLLKQPRSRARSPPSPAASAHDGRHADGEHAPGREAGGGLGRAAQLPGRVTPKRLTDGLVLKERRRRRRVSKDAPAEPGRLTAP